MFRILRLAAVAGALAFAGAACAAPHFDDIVVSDSKDGDAVETFAPNTPKIFLHAHLVGIPDGAKMKATWVATDTHGAAPPNYAIDSVELTAGGGINVLESNLSKPNNGWPLGKYRVDLSVDGTPAGTATFDIDKD